MSFDPTIPFAALGVTGAPPTSFAVRLAPPEALDALLGAPVDPRADHRADGEPAEAGLFDEHTFGPLRRDPEGRVLWERWADVEPRQRPQAVRFGAIDLPVPVVHPWLLRVTKGAPGKRLKALALCQRVVADGKETETPTDDADVLFGGDAVLDRIAAGALKLPESVVLRRIPVLPAGLRPTVQRDGQWLMHDLNFLYDLVFRRIVRYERLRQLNAPRLILFNEAAMLQRAVNALFIDGAVRHEEEDGPRWEPPEPKERPDLRSLYLYLAGEDWAEEVDKLVKAEQHAFSKRWHSPAYFFRAWLEAAALEPYPLTADGAPDEPAIAKARVDRAARLFDDVYTQVIGPLWRTVVHGPTTESPHIDVYASEPRKDGTRLLLTAGMSTRPMSDHPLQGPCRHRHVELAMQVPATIDERLLQHLMHGLLAVALYPFRNGTHFAPRHNVSVGKSIAPDSPLSAFVFTLPLARDPFEALSMSLPRTPRYLLTFAISEAELRHLTANQNSIEAVKSLLDRTRGVTDPGRASLY